MLWLFAVFAENCGTAQHDAADTINRTVAQSASSGRVDPNSESFQEVMRLARLANQAADGGDADQAAQYQALVAIQIAVAEAAAVQTALNTKLASIRKKNEALQAEIDTVTAAVREKEIANERDRIRTHVLSVVDESRRKAAADEELRARFKGEKFISARIVVGNEILKHARMCLAAVDTYTDRGFIRQEEAASLCEAATAAETALAAGDLFQVQMIAEHLAVRALELLNGAWPDPSSAPMEEAARAVTVFLRSRNLNPTQDSTGRWVILGLPPVTMNQSAETALAIAALCKAHPSIHLQVFNAVADEKSAKSAKLKNQQTLTAWAEKLKDLGIAASIRSTGCAAAAPLSLPSGSTSNTTLVIIPTPDSP